ncbi:hypothetical protein GF319_00725 [Candidatus Bathyarchaeota archaeon]|nr:hypothetical protein [Candidatus Bathyarchaeota archaeon]
MASGDGRSLRVRIRDVLEEILQSGDLELEVIKEEVWEDLASLYYRYEDSDQKRAFREVIYDISDKISSGDWDQVYQKIYRTDRREKEL